MVSPSTHEKVYYLMSFEILAKLDDESFSLLSFHLRANGKFKLNLWFFRHSLKLITAAGSCDCFACSNSGG